MTPRRRRAPGRAGGRRLLTAAAAGLIAATTAGCTGGSQADTPDAVASKAERPPATRGQDPRPARPIASADGDLPRADLGPAKGTGTNRATADVLSLEGGERLITTTLRVTLQRPGGDATAISDVDGFFAAARENRDASGLAVIDGRSGRRHPVAREPSGACACSRGLTDSLMSGETLTMTATFAAPPAGVERVGLEVPGFGTIPSVPISR